MSRGLGAAVSRVKRPTVDDTRATYAAKLAKAPLDFQPGTPWSYSPGAGLDVVSGIIEIVSGTPFEEFVRERIFTPLVMNNTYFDEPSDEVSKRVVLKGLDFSSKKGGWGIHSTAENYLHFEQMLLGQGELFGNRLLRPATVAMMCSNHVGDLYSNAGKKGQKGMGFGYTVAVTIDPAVAANYRGKGSLGWGGAAGTMSWTDPENELVAVIMLQQPSGSMQQDFAKAIQEAIIE